MISDNSARKIREFYADGTPLSADMTRYKDALEMAHGILMREKSIERTVKKLTRMVDPSTGSPYVMRTAYKYVRECQQIFGDFSDYNAKYLRNLLIGEHLAKYEKYSKMARRAEMPDKEAGDMPEPETDNAGIEMEWTVVAQPKGIGHNLKWAEYYTKKAQFHMTEVRRIAKLEEDSPYEGLEASTYEIKVDDTMRQLVKFLGASGGVIDLAKLVNFKLPEYTEAIPVDEDDAND